jgi:taurine dioxygenase
MGADPTRPLTPAEVAAIETALIDHEVVVFRGLEHITVDDQVRFASHFGELTVHPFSPNMADRPEVIVLDNHKDNPPRLTDVWHSDETFRDEPPLGTLLLCRITPEIGGDTLFASMTCAYEGLSDRMQRHIDGLEAVHDFKPFRTLFGGDPAQRAKLREMEDSYPNPTHPVVRLHPVSGRRILNVNPQFTLRIVGMGQAESDALLNFLYAQALVPDYQLRVRWEPGQMAFWDNRATQHYAVHDYWPQRRRMERVTLKGDRPFGVESADSVGGIKKAWLRTEGLTAASGETAARNFER